MVSAAGGDARRWSAATAGMHGTRRRTELDHRALAEALSGGRRSGDAARSRRRQRSRWPICMRGLLCDLRKQLAAHFGESETLEVMLGVPANANSNQRFLTVDAFRRAGFTVLGLLNEPSAASIEFGHRQHIAGAILVYDLGGGTFDASLVELDESTHTVLATEGISTLGGDDFDRVLAEMAVGPEELAALDPAALFRLEEECRRQKEALHPNSRRMVVDLDVDRRRPGPGRSSRCPNFTSAAVRLLEETIGRDRATGDGHEIDALYVTGGGSELPLVARMLREEFGRKVKRSEYTRSATAIGLAIQADASVRLHAARSVHAQLRRVARIGGRPAHGFRSDLPARHSPARRGRASDDRVAALSAGAQHRRFPLSRSGQRRRARPAVRRHHGVGRDSVPVRSRSGGCADLEPSRWSGRPGRTGADLEERYACDAAGVVTVDDPQSDLALRPGIPAGPMERQDRGGAAPRPQTNS